MKAMPDGQHSTIDPSADPVILAVMFVLFLICAVGPFALCVLGSIREQRAMRRYAAANRSEPAVAPAQTVASLITSDSVALHPPPPPPDNDPVPAAAARPNSTR